MKKRNILLLSLVLVLSLMISACSNGNTVEDSSAEPNAQETNSQETSVETKILKLGHIAAPNTAYDDYANEFKRLIEERTEGKYQIDIYPAGQLGVDRELMESLQVGNVDFTIITASDINQFVPEMGVQDLPYLFMGWDHVENFLDSDVVKEFYEQTDSVGMTTLSFMPRGFRHITTANKPIYAPEDLKGVKLRVAESEVYIDTFKALGANAQAMAWSEVYTALQQGTIDGHENTIITTRDYKIYEVQNYMSESGHFFAFAALQMNPDLLKGMSEEEQRIFKEAGLEAGKNLGLQQKELEAAAKEELIGYGMEFNEVNDKQEFANLVKEIHNKFLESNDSYFFDKIQELQ